MVNVKNFSLTLGFLAAIVHTIGVLGMRFGLMEYWQWAHLVKFQYSLSDFNAVAFVVGIVTAFVVGAFVGHLFASLYNKMNE